MWAQESPAQLSSLPRSGHQGANLGLERALEWRRRLSLNDDTSEGGSGGWRAAERPGNHKLAFQMSEPHRSLSDVKLYSQTTQHTALGCFCPETPTNKHWRWVSLHHACFLRALLDNWQILAQPVTQRHVQHNSSPALPTLTQSRLTLSSRDGDRGSSEFQRWLSYD